jgi:superfamily II DNA or RNA helicase
MPPGKFTDERNVRHSYERVFSDVKLYRALGASAKNGIEFGDASIEVRDYQLETWEAIGRARAEGKDSALVHLATGLGKTTVGVVDALDFATDFYEREGRPPKIMFAVHQTEILDQAAKRFREFAPSLSQGYYVGRKKNTNNALTFATMQSLSQNLTTIDPKEFDYILYDEAHHAQAETYRDVIEHFNPDFKLALTATPDRMDEEDIRDLFGEEVYSKPLPEAMVEGYLADVDYHIVFDDAVKRAMEAGFTPETLGEIRDLMNNESRNEEIALQIWGEMERIGLEGAKTIVFCQDIQQADEMAKLLGGKAYHSGIKDGLSETLDEFRNNSLQIITTRDMFNEGVDVPDAQLLVFLRSTSSRTVFEQQLGRGLRKHLGKDTVSVLDFVANIERLTQVKDLVDAITERQPKGERDSDGDEEGLSSGLTIHTDHAGFDFDKISVALLEKVYAIRERTNRYVPRTIEEAAVFWRENFGDEEPTKAKIEEASKNGLYTSNIVIRSLGGTLMLKQALGFEARPVAETIEEAAALWRDRFGDEEPTTASIIDASKAGQFVSTTIISKFGGVNALKAHLGFNVTEPLAIDINTIEDAAVLWREKFGDEEPTKKGVIQAFQDGRFVSVVAVDKLGGLNALKETLGFRQIPKVETIEAAAALWRENFGDEEPSHAKISEALKLGQFVSKHTIARLGGSAALKRALGFEARPATGTIEEAAALWRETFGDQEPTTKKIQEASQNGLYVSNTIIQRFGGISSLRRALGFEEATPIQDINEAAELWRENFGNRIPTEGGIIEAAESGQFISINTLYRLGTISSLKQALGFETRPVVETIEDAAALWRESFGDEEPTTKKIQEASKQNSYISWNTLSKLGGIDALQQTLGFVSRPTADTIEDAAALWRQNFGDETPTQEKISKASKEKLFISPSSITKLGGMSALKQALH